MGVFRNIQRIIGDVAPLVAAVAPIVAPGIGGFLAGAIAQQFVRRGVVGARPVPRPANPCQPPAFSSPFQSANFPTGGSLPGRGLAFLNTFQPRSAVGRVALDRCPPSRCPCPSAVAPSRFTPAQQSALDRFGIRAPVAPVVAAPVVPAPVVAASVTPTLSQQNFFNRFVRQQSGTLSTTDPRLQPIAF